MTLNTSLQAYMADLCLKLLIPDESRQTDPPPFSPVVALYAVIQNKEKAEAKSAKL